MTEKTHIIVPALNRALNILEFLAMSPEPVSLKMIAETMRIPSASAYRIVRNLVARGYIQEHDSAQSVYTLGERVVNLAKAKERGNSLATKAIPLMRDLTVSTGQTVQLAVMRQGTLSYIAQALSDSPSTVNVVSPLYTPLSIHTSAAGKVLFSQLSQAEQTQYLSDMLLPSSTPHTITTPEAFTDEIKKTLERGYGVDDEEYAIGIGCLAVPVFKENRCVAALGITGAIAAYRDSENRAMLLRQLRDCAQVLSDSILFC